MNGNDHTISNFTVNGALYVVDTAALNTAISNGVSAVWIAEGATLTGFERTVLTNDLNIYGNGASLTAAVNGDLIVKNCTFDNYNNALCGIDNGGDSVTEIIGCTFTNINGEAIGYVASTLPADFEAEAIANNIGITAENVIGYKLLPTIKE